MGSIQEALRELKSQRTLKENKTKKVEKKLTEGTLYDKVLAAAKRGGKVNVENKKDESVEVEQPVDEVKEEVEEVAESEETLEEDVNFLLVDEDGDIEDPSFNLSTFANESLTEGLKASDIKEADERFKNISDSLIKKLIKFRKNDVEDTETPTAEVFIEWVDDACEGGPLTPLAIEFGPELLATDVWELVEGDTKFEEVVKKYCQKINWIDKDGNVIGDGLPDDVKDGARDNAKKPTIEKLVLDLVRTSDGVEEELFDNLSNAYFNDNYDKINESLLEDLQSSLPVHALPENTILDVVRGIKNGTARVDENGEVIVDAHGEPVWSKHPTFFSLEYFYEIEVAAKYRGGRGSTSDDPKVRIFKDVKFNRLYTGYDYESLGSVKANRAATGSERSDKPTGVNFNNYKEDDGLYLKIADGKDGKLLRAALCWDCNRIVTYYISINNGDLVESSREEVAKYLTPRAAADLLKPKGLQKNIQVINPKTGEVKEVPNKQPVNNYKLCNIVNIRSYNN